MKKFILAYPFFFMLVALFQWIAGAYTNECGCHPDEAAHYLSGLLVRDYLVSGTYVSPLDYAEHFYVHYPKLAIGHWPPLFHAVEGAWGVLFSSSRSSILVLLALCTTTLAFLVYRAVRSDFGNCAGLLAGVLMVSLPLVQKSTGMVMAEMFLALLCFAAALAFGHFLDTII